MFALKASILRLNAVLKMGNSDVFLIVVQILVLTRSWEVAMTMNCLSHPTCMRDVGTTVHQTKVQEICESATGY